MLQTHFGATLLFSMRIESQALTLTLGVNGPLTTTMWETMQGHSLMIMRLLSTKINTMGNLVMFMQRNHHVVRVTFNWLDYMTVESK